MSFFRDQLETLRSADIIFIDGPKDGRFVRAFTDLLLAEFAGSGTLLVYDDIRLRKMIAFWRWSPLPKLDVSSLRHYTGTGLARL